MMYCEEEDTPEGENKPSQTDALDAEAKRKGKRLDPAEKPLTKQSKEDAKAKRLAKQSEEDAKAKEKDGHSGKKSQKSSSSATDQVEEDAKAKLNKGSPPDLNAPSAISNSGAEFIDNTMKEMPAPIEQTAARSCSTSSSNRSISSARSLADDEAKANARNQMVPSRVRREGGKGNPKVSSKEENMSDEAAKASARNQMVPSRVRRTGGGGGDEEFSAATVIEATVFPGSPPAIEYEEDGSILPGAQKVRVSGVNKLEYIIDDDLEDLEGQPSSKNDDGPAKVRNDNLGHATAIVAELAPTDAEVSQKLQKMVEDRFDQELKKQVVVEAVQAVAMGNDEEGKKVCGVATSRKCWLLLVLGLLVMVAVAVGAGVGASKGGDSGSSESGTSNADAPLSETTNGPKEPAGTDAPVSGTATYGPQEPTGAPSNSRLGELLSAIGPTILENDPNALEPGTPTAQALDWMANTDRSNLDFVTTRSSVLVERYALAVFYFATNGPAWFNRNNFLEPTSVCSWNNGQVTAGIFCNGQSVAQIFMNGNLVAGPFPPQLALLTRLTNVYLPFNELTGTLPTELASLKFLEMLYLAYNKLSGTIPTEIGLFTSLSESFGINDNEFASGTLPTEIGLLTNIKGINMGSCSLSGTIPSQVGKLTKLSSLDLTFNELTGIVPVELESLPLLDFLNIEYNLLTGDLSNTTLCQQLGIFGADCSTGCTCCINSGLCG